MTQDALQRTASRCPGHAERSRAAVEPRQRRNHPGARLRRRARPRAAAVVRLGPSRRRRAGPRLVRGVRGIARDRAPPRRGPRRPGRGVHAEHDRRAEQGRAVAAAPARQARRRADDRVGAPREPAAVALDGLPPRAAARRWLARRRPSLVAARLAARARPHGRRVGRVERDRARSRSRAAGRA